MHTISITNDEINLQIIDNTDGITQMYVILVRHVHQISHHYYYFLTQMSIIKPGSLLSNLSISNVSVKIGNKPGEGSEFFNFTHSMVNEADQNIEDKSYQVKLDQISNEEYNLQDNSMLNQIIKKEEKHDGSTYLYNTPIIPNFTATHWAVTKKEGISEEENSESDQEQRIKIQQEAALLKKIKNETKNIPKNYGKAIISFIQKYHQKVKQICDENNVPYDDFTQQLTQVKKTINTIADLRNLWINYKYAKCMRIVSNLFLRKYSLNYIFNSRVCNYGSHVKYRYRLCQAIKNPKNFKHIKDY